MPPRPNDECAPTEAGRELPPGVFGFDDVTAGDRTITGEAKVGAALIDTFAGLTGDRFEIHMDKDAAIRSGFTDRVAHGLLVLSIVDGLKNQTPAQFRAIASLSWDWSFHRPVLAGDTIHAEITVADKRTTSNPARGILQLAFAVINQHGETVQDGTNLLMVHRRTEPA